MNGEEKERKRQETNVLFPIYIILQDVRNNQDNDKNNNIYKHTLTT